MSALPVLSSGPPHVLLVDLFPPGGVHNKGPESIEDGENVEELPAFILVLRYSQTEEEEAVKLEDKNFPSSHKAEGKNWHKCLLTSGTSWN